MSKVIDFSVLDKFQDENIDKFLRDKKRFLGWETGVGKTRVAIKSIHRLWNERLAAHHCMIVCPPTVFSSVREALQDFKIPESYYTILNDKKIKDDLIRKQHNSKHWKPILVMSYDFFKQDVWIRGEKFKDSKGFRQTRALGLINTYKPFFVFFDESHKLKTFNSAVTKKAILTTHLDFIQYRLLGSATYSSSQTKYKDMFSQFLVMDKGETFGKNFHAFKAKYYIDLNRARAGTQGYFPDEVLDKTKEGELVTKTRKYFSLLRKEDVGVPMPKLNEHIITLPFDVEQKRIYDEVLKELKIEFKQKQEDVENKLLSKEQFYTHALSRINALRQICCGFIYRYDLLDEKVRHADRVPTKKILSLEKGIQSIPYVDKFIVWSVYKESFKILEELMNRNNIEYVMIHGSITNKKREVAVQQFKNNPSVRCLISHPASGGAGLNLQIAKWAFYFSQNYSFIDAEQSKGRNFRVGSITFHDNIHHVYLRTKNSIETEITQNIRKKVDFVKSFEQYLLTT